MSNNIKVLFFHILLGIPTFILLLMFEINEKHDNLIVFSGLLILLIVMIFLYVLFGSRLKVYTDWKANLKSVVLPSLIGLFMWSVLFIIKGDLDWLLFYAYNGAFFSLFFVLKPQTNNLALFFNFIAAILPSLLFWIGIELKGRTKV